MVQCPEGSLVLRLIFQLKQMCYQRECPGPAVAPTLACRLPMMAAPRPHLRCDSPVAQYPAHWFFQAGNQPDGCYSVIWVQELFRVLPSCTYRTPALLKSCGEKKCTHLAKNKKIIGLYIHLNYDNTIRNFNMWLKT